MIEIEAAVLHVCAFGAKATEVPVKIAEMFPNEAKELLAQFHPRLIDEHVKAGRLVEIEYVLQDQPYRAKSFLLPHDAEVRVIDHRA